MANPAQIQVREDVRQSEAYCRYMESIGWVTWTTPITKIRVFIKKLGPISLAKIQRMDTLPLEEELLQIYLKYRTFMCKLEPSEKIETPLTETIKRSGFRRSSWPLLGTKTLRINLRPDEEKIFAGFKKDCRYEIRRSEDRKPDTEINQFDKFYEIWKTSAKRKKLWIPPKKDYISLINVFGKNVFSITSGDQAGAVILINNGTAFYYYAGSSETGVKKNLPYSVVWRAMKEAKIRGCKVWDFEGIYDPRWPNEGWKGFSHFKKSFGGEEVEFPGAFEKWRWPI